MAYLFLDTILLIQELKKEIPYQGNDYMYELLYEKGFNDVTELTPTNFERKRTDETILLNPC